MPSVARRSVWLWALGALAAGLAVGVLDLSASEVQGPVLLLMTVAFAFALPGRVPGWMVAALAALGIPAAHAGAHLFGRGAGASWGMLIAFIPALVAAYAGHAIGALVRSAADTVLLSASPETRDQHGDSWLRRPAGSRLLLSGTLVACAVAGSVPVYATLAARAQPFAWWVALLWQLVTLAAWAAAAPAILGRWRSAAARRELAAPDLPAGGTSPAELGTHAAAVLLGAAVHALMLVVLTRALFVPLGPSGVARAVAWAFAAYLTVDGLVYVLLRALAYASDTSRYVRDAAQRTAGLTASLTASRLEALTAQLRPHFLFNALNAAVVLARRGDAAGAVRVLTGLAQLLRYVLDAHGSVVRLADELAFAERYLEIEHVRFPDRLRPTIIADPTVHDALVPVLLLQPLIENAVRHGVAGRLGAGEVCLRAWPDGTLLHISVEDDGPGPQPGEPGSVIRPGPLQSEPGTIKSPGPPEEIGPTGTQVDDATGGIGLANTRVRLAILYGTRASLSLSSRPGGGAIAQITLPLSRGTQSPEPETPAAPPATPATPHTA